MNTAPDRTTILPDAVVDAALAEVLNGWEHVDGGLQRRFVFPDFVAAFAFMTKVALAAERLFHHPDWSNSWNTVDIRVSNHAAGGLTEIDLELCRRITAAGIPPN